MKQLLRNRLYFSNRGSNLSEEDFKNIWARLWLKGWWMFVLAILSIVGTGYIYIKKTAESTVKEIINQDVIKGKYLEYKEQLLTKAAEDIREAKNTFIKEMSLYSGLPYNISKNSLLFFDSTGNRLLIEFGSGFSNEEVFFKNKFKNPPSVIVNFKDSLANGRQAIISPMGIGTLTFSAITVRATINSFIPIFIRLKTKNYGEAKKPKYPISWIAIGE